ncbi:hypothetical protein [Mesorhizobium temperatum]|uniref:hypothetical protein n=1 Tax=Mesorhizobium temperatum TaxID=241416 RepID=UPI00117BE3EF|nr:hypothetical protein [Mesorhizobium temperatum]
MNVIVLWLTAGPFATEVLSARACIVSHDETALSGGPSLAHRSRASWRAHGLPGSPFQTHEFILRAVASAHIGTVIWFPGC